MCLMRYVKDFCPDCIVVNGGDDGQAFLIFNATPEEMTQFEEKIMELANKDGYENAYWCPEPDSHHDDVVEAIDQEWTEIAVFNLFR